MKTNSPKQAPDFHKVVTDYRTGNRSSAMLLNGVDGRPDNYRLNLSGEGSTGDWTTPRHRHTKEQFRYVLAGEYQITDKEVLPQGWVAYFPEGAWYGPQVKSANLYMLTLQFGGPTGLGHFGPKTLEAAIQRLKTRGKFEDGVYTWTDKDGKKHNQDAAEATEEEIRGHAVQYPPQRFRDVVMMNPAAFGWVKDKELAGVARKNLGSFSERDIRFGFVRMDKGASLDFGVEDSSEILFINEGALTHDNSRYDKHVAFSTDPDEKPVQFKAVEPTELVYMKLPTFGKDEPLIL